MDDSNAPLYRWFAGAECNTCYNAVDRHVEDGRGDQDAIIYDSPITGHKSKITYSELQDKGFSFCRRFESARRYKRDRVIIYMPMIPEAAIAMLAVARLGAIHSVVFGGFASNELAVRINDAKPKVIVSSRLAGSSRVALLLINRCWMVRLNCLLISRMQQLLSHVKKPSLN